MTERHGVTRIRRERRRRQITVARRVQLSPTMVRLVFTAPDLADFESAAPDDHIKLFFEGTDGERAMRDYTPRAFNNAAQSLTIDFALHQAGPATAWALEAQVGDSLSIGGPQGSTVVADDFDWVLLIGDETALPAIGRRLEELRAEVLVTVAVITDTPDDRIDLPAREGLTVAWTDRTGGADAAQLIAALPASLLAGEGYVWIAAEAEVARAVRTHIVDALGHPRAWVKASGYWIRGEAGSDKNITD